MNKILAILRTPGAMLVALVLALIAQLEHTARVFSAVVDATGVWSQVHAYIFAISVETAVLLFVLAGHKRISYGFAIATAATNLSYYAMHGIDLLSIAAIPAWLMSLLLPAAIVGYSHTIAETSPAIHKPNADAIPEPTTQNADLPPVEAPVSVPAPSQVSIGADDSTNVPGVNLPEADVTPDKRAQAEQMKSEGLSNRQIAAQLSVNPATVGRWLQQSATHTNGVQHA